MRPRSLLQCLVPSGIAILMVAMPGALSAEPSLATAVKAAYIYKFAPFVTWPAAPPSTTAFTICLVGANPFGLTLDSAISGLSYENRPYTIIRVDTVGPNSTCDIAYLGGSSKQSIANALAALRGTPTLTITDENSPAGIISFKMQAGKVRFRIDQTAATANGLTLSSKLLNLALSVKTDQGIVERD